MFKIQQALDSYRATNFGIFKDDNNKEEKADDRYKHKPDLHIDTSVNLYKTKLAPVVPQINRLNDEKFAPAVTIKRSASF